MGRDGWLAHLKHFNYMLIMYKCLITEKDWLTPRFGGLSADSSEDLNCLCNLHRIWSIGKYLFKVFISSHVINSQAWLSSVPSSSCLGAGLAGVRREELWSKNRPYEEEGGTCPGHRLLEASGAATSPHQRKNQSSLLFCPTYTTV